MENQEQKETYQKKFQDQLDEWRADIDRLRERAKTASAETKHKYSEQIDKLELKLEEGRARLNEMKESGADVWDSVKDGAESIWDTMKATFSEVKDKLRDKEEEEGKNK
jgi:chromosome segregation ATPase